jgi:hypothetical protein
MSARQTEPADVRTVIVSRTDQQLHPIPQMTTFELRDLRRALEETLAMETRLATSGHGRNYSSSSPR